MTAGKWIDVDGTRASMPTEEQGNTSGLQGPTANRPLAYRINGWNATRLDIDQTETLVTAAPAWFGGVVGNDGNTGYTDIINANATGSAATPTFRHNCGDGTSPLHTGGTYMSLGICVDGESVGHDVTVLWTPVV